MEKQYRRLCLDLGWVMLAHMVLINGMGGVLALFEWFATEMAWRTDNLIYQIVYATLYLAAFMLPVALYRLISRKRPFAPMGFAPRFSAVSVPLIFATLGVILPAAYLNQNLMELLELLGGVNPMDYVSPTYAIFPEDFVLQHMTLALVPAFCEEFLFRGLICSRLLPYGRTTAIVGSAVLFGLMHGNLAQLFYATVAGLMLGWCYVETRSIWPGVIAHMLNNTVSFLGSVWYDELPVEQAAAYDTLLTYGLLMVGGCCFVWLLCRARRDAQTLCAADVAAAGVRSYTALPVSVRLRGMLAPTMAVYLSLSLLGIWLIQLIYGVAAAIGGLG